MSSASAMYHPGLFFATLVVQLAGAHGSPVSDVRPHRDDAASKSMLVYRRHGSGGNDDCEEEGKTCGSGSTSSTPKSGSVSSTASQDNITQSTTVATSSSSTPGAAITPAPTPTPAPIQQITTQPHRPDDITLGSIVGIALGGFAILSMFLLLCGYFYRRRRRSRDHPQATLPPAYNARPEAQHPQTEMSQTLSSPLVAPAVASRITSTPPLHYGLQPSPSGSLSPLIPAASLQHSPSLTSSSNRRTSLSYTDGSSSHEPLRSTHDMQTTSSSWSLSQPSSAVTNSFTSGLVGIIMGSRPHVSPQSEPSNLVIAMTAYQKSLEAEDQKISQSGSSSGGSTKDDEQDITESHDPPPRYDA